MNKRGQLSSLFLIFLLVLLPFASADLQDTLQQKADSIQDKADKVENITNTFSDKESREQYLSNKWAEFINKTPLGKAITSTTATIKTADPLIELIFGAKFEWSLSFLLIFSIWLFIFAYTRKRIMPSISSKLKVYSPLIHGVIAFIFASLLGGLKLIPLLAKSIIVSPVSKIPSLFLQILIILVISCLLIWYSIKIKYPYYEEYQRQRNDKQDEIMAQERKELKNEENKIARQKEDIREIEKETGVSETKNLSLEERQLRRERRKVGLEAAEKIGETLEESEEEVDKRIKKAESKKVEKIGKTKKLR